jgi:hypothetical protein
MFVIWMCWCEDHTEYIEILSDKLICLQGRKEFVCCDHTVLAMIAFQTSLKQLFSKQYMLYFVNSYHLKTVL